MTYLLDDSGNEIVLNTEVTVTKQVLSFFNFKIKGNFSTNFNIPNTSATRRALGYYGVNQSEKVAFSNQAWNLYKDGNLLTRGFLVIQGENKDELDCFFASGNASWISTLAGNLKELNWSSYDQDFTSSNVDSLKTASTGMVFPLIDWGYNFKKNLFEQPFVDAIYDSSNENETFIYDLYPCFYLKTILKEIAKQKQIKITGNIFDDPTFDKMVIPLPFIDRSLGDENYMTDNDTYAGNQYIGAGATVTATFAYENNPNSLLDLTNGRIQNDNRSRNVRVKIAFTFDSAFTGSVLLRKNGATIETYNFTVASFLRYETLSLASNDYLDVQITNSSGFTRSITDKYFGYQLCGSWYRPGLKLLAADVIPNTKVIEVVKYIVQAFNCIADFDDFSRTITINKIDSVRKEDATDLTETVIDYSIEWQNDFAKTNYIRVNQFEDLEPFNKQELKFGEFAYDGPDNGKSEDDTFELKFGGSVIRNLDLEKVCTTNIPLYKLEDNSDPISFSSITSSSGGFTVLNGLPSQLNTNQVIKILSNDQSYQGYAVIFQSTATTATITIPFKLNVAGVIVLQKIQYNNAGFRVLLTNPNYLISKFSSTGFGKFLIDPSFTRTSITNIHFATYYIPDTEHAFSDELRLGAHAGPIDNAVSIPLSTQYYKRLQKIARNPKINVTLRLSETQFNTLSLSEFVYLDIGKWSGYFFVQQIRNYKDSITPVRAELLKVD